MMSAANAVAPRSPRPRASARSVVSSMTGAVRLSRTWARRWSVSRSLSAAPHEARAEGEQIGGDRLPGRDAGGRVDDSGGDRLGARGTTRLHLSVVAVDPRPLEDLGGQVEQLAPGAGRGGAHLAVELGGVQPPVHGGHRLPVLRRRGPVGQGQRRGVAGADAVTQQVVQEPREGGAVDRVGLRESLQAVGQGVEAAGERRVGQLKAGQQVPQGRHRRGRAPAGRRSLGTLVAVHVLRPGRRAG